MLTRYKVLHPFALDGNEFLEGSTFLDDDELTGELLHKSGFLQPKPQNFNIEVTENPYKKVNYLCQMTKGQLLTVAKNENIPVDEKQNKITVLAQIRRERAKRGESTR